MKRASKFLTSALALTLLLTTSGFSRSLNQSRSGGPVRDPGGHRQMCMLDGNNVRASISNWGEYGNPDLHVNFFGYEYPNSSGNEFLFSAGLWVGAVVDGEYLVSTGTDGDNGTNEFSPSINDYIKQSNVIRDDQFNLSLIAFDDDNDWNVENDDLDGNGEPSLDWDGEQEDGNADGISIYDPEPHIDEDPPGDISNDLIDNDHDGWVDELDNDLDGDRAPDENDDDGDGLADEDGAAMAANQITAIFDDIDRREVHSPDNDGHTPLNIRVEQTSYSWNLPDNPVCDAVIFEVMVRNVGQDTLRDVRFGIFADPDISAAGETGDVASLDDWNYFDSENLMAIQGDDTTDGDEWGPGVFAIKILRAPLPRGELNVGFKNFSRSNGGDPETNRSKYTLLADHEENNSSMTESGDDWRFVISLGAREEESAWELLPTESIDFVFAMISGEDHFSIYSTAEAVQNFYDSGRDPLFRGEFTPHPAKPEVADIGTGDALLATWHDYARLPQIASVNLHYGDRENLQEVVNVGETTEQVIDSLEEGREYYFVVSLVDTVGNLGPVSDTTWATPQSVPRKPRSFRLVDELFQAISLDWRPSSSPERDLAGYNIYRARNGGRLARVNQVPIDLTSFVDQIDRFGTYTYRLTAVDNDGNESDAYGADSLDNIVIGAPFTLTNDRILVVDETRNGNGRAGSPDDQSVDIFYSAIVFRHYDTFDYDTFYNVNNRLLTAREIGDYRTILWHSDDKSTPLLRENLPKLERFVELGGDLVISGWDVLTNFAPSDLDSHAFPQESFARRLGIVRGKKSLNREFVGAHGIAPYADVSILPAKIPVNWDGLDECWGFELERGRALYQFNSGDDESEFEGKICAVKSGIGLGDIILLGFPIYFLTEATAVQLMDKILTDLQVDVPTEESISVPSMVYLSANYPNPFNSSTILKYGVVHSGLVSLKVFDLAGREVAVLKRGFQLSGNYTARWKAEGLPSGIYVARLETASESINTRITLIR